VKKLLIFCLALLSSGCSTPVEVAERVRTHVDLEDRPEDEPSSYSLLRLKGRPEASHLLMSGSYSRTGNDLHWDMGTGDEPLIVRAKIHGDRIELTIPRHSALIPAYVASGKFKKLEFIARSQLRRMDTPRGVINGVVDESSPWLSMEELATADRHWE